MITGSPVEDLFIWLLFSFILFMALWRGYWDAAERQEEYSDGRQDIHFFPEEVGADVGPGMVTAPGREAEPRDEPGRGQANELGADCIVAVVRADQKDVRELNCGTLSTARGE
jgi:hypothetical protein